MRSSETYTVHPRKPLQLPKRVDVVIIGGGATGLGIARDLSLRGVENLLLERRDLACGATGGCHGLLHSGARYVVRDPHSAGECIAENRILRRIASACVEDTGGLFIGLRGEDKEYRKRFVAACATAGIPTEPLSRRECLDRVPAMTDRLEEAFFVPDCAIDPFRLCHLNAFSAQKHGSLIATHREVTAIEHNDGRVTGVRFHNYLNGADGKVSARYVIIAAGAWTGRLAALAGVHVPVVCSKGSLIIFNHRFADIVINRCRPPSDGDILVPNEAVSIIGTTSQTIDNPDHLRIKPEEIDRLINAGREVIPDFAERRIIREYSGVRPLLGEPNAGKSGRNISRGFTIFDHGERDGLEGLLSIVGGKLTTYRLMAEKLVDHLCLKMGHHQPCVTHEQPLEGQDRLKGFPLSKHLQGLSHDSTGGEVICECELVTERDILKIASELEYIDLDDIRRRTRMGMGSCQGGYCTIRCLELLIREGYLPGDKAIDQLTTFLERRYHGILPVLRGDMIREQQLIEAIYLSSLNLHAWEEYHS